MKDNIMFIKTEKKINYKYVYNNNLKYFQECDYLWKKYHLPYTICYIESLIDLDFSDTIRLLDRYIKINNRTHIILFTHIYFEDGCSAILRLERKFLTSNKEHIFKFGIDGIKKYTKITDKIKSIDILQDIIINTKLL